jgi:hypothetical protein
MVTSSTILNGFISVVGSLEVAFALSPGSNFSKNVDFPDFDWPIIPKKNSLFNTSRI